jgi:hypothetical protein
MISIRPLRVPLASAPAIVSFDARGANEGDQDQLR